MNNNFGLSHLFLRDIKTVRCSIPDCVCVCVCICIYIFIIYIHTHVYTIYIYIYIYTHTHSLTHTQSGLLQRTVFINKIRMLKRTQMLQRTRTNTIGWSSTRVRMTCRASPLWLERQSSSLFSFARFSYQLACAISNENIFFKLFCFINLQLHFLFRFIFFLFK